MDDVHTDDGDHAECGMLDVNYVISQELLRSKSDKESSDSLVRKIKAAILYSLGESALWEGKGPQIVPATGGSTKDLVICLLKNGFHGHRQRQCADAVGGKLLEIESKVKMILFIATCYSTAQAGTGIQPTYPPFVTGIHDGVWLSLNDFVREGDFVWLSSGAAPTYTNWAPRHPEDLRTHEGGQDCVFMNRQGLWDDHWCELYESGFHLMPTMCNAVGAELLEIGSKSENDFIHGHMERT
ncbi:hypothetical protein BaRGS_00005744, partial [Batillaria attramentaria]